MIIKIIIIMIIIIIILIIIIIIITIAIISHFCIWWLEAATKIEKYKNVKDLISVRNCKKCYVNREISS